MLELVIPTIEFHDMFVSKYCVRLFKKNRINSTVVESLGQHSEWFSLSQNLTKSEWSEDDFPCQIYWYNELHGHEKNVVKELFFILMRDSMERYTDKAEIISTRSEWSNDLNYEKYFVYNLKTLLHISKGSIAYVCYD